LQYGIQNSTRQGAAVSCCQGIIFIVIDIPNCHAAGSNSSTQLLQRVHAHVAQLVCALVKCSQHMSRRFHALKAR
jgi:hypothetical protein